MAKNTATPAPKKKTFTRVDRRNAILNAAARRMMNDPAATWNNFAKIFAAALYPNGVADEDLTEEKIRAALAVILDDAANNLQKGKRKGAAADLIQIGIDMPRGRK